VQEGDQLPSGAVLASARMYDASASQSRGTAVRHNCSEPWLHTTCRTRRCGCGGCGIQPARRCCTSPTARTRRADITMTTQGATEHLSAHCHWLAMLMLWQWPNESSATRPMARPQHSAAGLQTFLNRQHGKLASILLLWHTGPILSLVTHQCAPGSACFRHLSQKHSTGHGS
jgi:hypothetical protein